MNKAEHVIKALGGATNLSKVTGIPRSTIEMWKRPKPVGSGGRIPDKHQRRLERLAEELGMEELKEFIVDQD